MADEDRILQVIEALRSDLQANLAPIKAPLDGLALIQRRQEDMHRDIRMLRAAINDLAREHPTSGELEALRTDLNRVETNHGTLAGLIETLERLYREREER